MVPHVYVYIITSKTLIESQGEFRKPQTQADDRSRRVLSSSSLPKDYSSENHNLPGLNCNCYFNSHHLDCDIKRTRLYVNCKGCETSDTLRIWQTRIFFDSGSCGEEIHLETRRKCSYMQTQADHFKRCISDRVTEKVLKYLCVCVCDGSCVCVCDVCVCIKLSFQRQFKLQSIYFFNQVLILIRPQSLFYQRLSISRLSCLIEKI